MTTERQPLRLIALLLAISLACNACGSKPDVRPASPAIWTAVPPLPDELRARAAGNNAFAFELFAEIRGQKGNLAFIGREERAPGAGCSSHDGIHHSERVPVPSVAQG
jgi:hypothetical protein